MNSKKVIIIGSGIGGLTAAVHLARHGFRVTVVEKNSCPGGRCGRVIREGHTFDIGPTLLVMPLLYEAEFQALGASMHEVLELRRVDPTYHLFFDDGSQLALSSDLKFMRSQLETMQPGSFQGLLRYLEEGDRHYQLVVEKLVNRDFRKASDFFTPSNLSLLYKVKPLINHYHNMVGYFKDPRLKSAFTFQDMYMGLSPFEAPATFSMMSYTELAHGVWYPRGGMYSIVEVLADMALETGVDFIYDAQTEKILTEDDRAKGVILEDGRKFHADVVLANADLPYVYEELLPQDGGVSRSMAHKRYSCSVISFFWGVDTPYPELPPHTLFLASDYRENFDSIIRDLDLPVNPSVYIHAPARLDPLMSPEGQDTVIAIVPVGHMSEKGDQNWDERRNKARQQIFRRLTFLGIRDLEKHIKFEMSCTPVSWRRLYNLVKGSTHGFAHTLNQLAYFRPHNRHARYHNLYFVGASTHPGTGMPTAMISGRLAAQRIVDEIGIYQG